MKTTKASVRRAFAYARAGRQAEYAAEVERLVASQSRLFKGWIAECWKLDGKPPAIPNSTVLLANRVYPKEAARWLRDRIHIGFVSLLRVCVPTAQDPAVTRGQKEG